MAVLTLGAEAPRSAGCGTDTITAWTDEMSTFIPLGRSQHLVTVGDEGFFADRPGSDDWTRNGGEGVDAVRLAASATST